jgi:uncharacterized membrane protein
MLRMRPVLAILLFACLAQPAAAALNVCNKTARTARVAVGRFDGTAWISEGWWTMESNHCSTIVPGKLNARYYYLYATDGGAGSWNGSRNFCIGTGETFQVRGRADCAGRGMDRKGFFGVDTGNKPDFTQTLSD